MRVTVSDGGDLYTYEPGKASLVLCTPSERANAIKALNSAAKFLRTAKPIEPVGEGPFFTKRVA